MIDCIARVEEPNIGIYLNMRPKSNRNTTIPLFTIWNIRVYPLSMVDLKVVTYDVCVSHAFFKLTGLQVQQFKYLR